MGERSKIESWGPYEPLKARMRTMGWFDPIREPTWWDRLRWRVDRWWYNHIRPLWGNDNLPF